MIFVMHWEHTLDVAWLRSVGYVYLKEVAAFWSCYLVKDANGVYLDLNDCCYEVCSANNYPVEVQKMTNPNNPANTIGMLHRLFATMTIVSAELGVDSDLRAGWQDIKANLAPLPTATVQLANTTTTILADWDNAGPPPKNDRQMLSALQPIYPAGQFFRSMPNQSAFQVAVDTMTYLDYLAWTRIP